MNYIATPSYLIALTLLASTSILSSQTKPLSPLEAVNLRIGTAGEGQTFPAVGVPFAMTNWTPETRSGETKCIAPYYDKDKALTGFRGSHFISGSCMRDYGSFTLMPESGELRLMSKDREATFRHSEESMSPAKYEVQLATDDIHAAISGLSRSGIFRFRFGQGSPAWVVVQNPATLPGGWTEMRPEAGEITGANPVMRLYAGSGKPAGFSGYFVIRFDHPIIQHGSWSGDAKNEGKTRQDAVGGESGMYAGFKLRPGETLTVRVGTSFVSVDQARKNLDGEIGTSDFDTVVEKSRQAWLQVLDKVRVSTKSVDDRTVFYTALYHASLHPRTYSDLDGSFPQFAGNRETSHAVNFTYYDDFSAWDTFRAVHPWLVLTDPKRESDMVRSLLEKGHAGGFLPIFPAWNSYTSEMIGDHAVAIIMDAYAKGLRTFDAQDAYRLIAKNAFEAPKNHALYADGRGRRALPSYLKYGYIPVEDPVDDAFHKGEQVSRTLEYAYDDFLAGQLASALGKAGDAAVLMKRSENWRNTLDTRSGWVRARHEDGSWVNETDPFKTVSWITEGLPAQYTFFVPQNIPGLIAVEGGPQSFADRLDRLFAAGAYDQGNEPSHHIAYLYDQAGSAWKTQQHINEIVTKQYRNRPDGLVGNDDAGQISAWYLFSAAGFYPVTPGTPVYWLGTPHFDRTEISLPSGKVLSISAPGAEMGKIYIASASWNGKPLQRAWLSHSELVSGGELNFVMSATPIKSWPNH